MSSGLLSAAEFAGPLPAPPTVSLAWRAFTLHVSEPPLHTTAAFADHLLASQISGRCRLRQAIDGRAVERWSGPGAVSLAPAQIKGTWDATGPSRVIHLSIPDAFLSRVIAEEWGAEPGRVALVGQFLVRDPVIEDVMARMALEVENGSPLGQLYAESASEFLTRHVIHSYSSLSTPPREAAGGLPARRLNLVLEYIDANLQQPVALHHLAGLAGVSTRHFERAFREAMGVAPYRYVLRKRVDTARHSSFSSPRSPSRRSPFGPGSAAAPTSRRRSAVRWATRPEHFDDYTRADGAASTTGPRPSESGT
jgi:AraC family transcriptional regulator